MRMTDGRAIVLVTSSFPIRADGSEAAGSFVADLAEALGEHVDVRVVAPGPREERSAWSRRVEVIRYPAPAWPLSTLKPWKPRDLVWLLRVLRGGPRATRLALADGASHVLALWGLPCGYWAQQAARTHRVPYSVWLLGSDVWSLGRIPLLRGMLARVIRGARRAFADGYRLADDARAIAGVPVAFLPSTRALALRDPPPPRSAAPFRLLFLGRWHPNKGIDLLLDALALLADEDWTRIECVEIHGGGPLESLVRERTAALRAESRPVEAGGFLIKSDAEAAIARADWLMIPSRIESIPVVFSDAMKLGRPVVSMPVGDLARLLDEAPVGVCAREVSAAAFADALRSALASSPAARSEALARAAIPFSLDRSIVPEILAGIETAAGAAEGETR